MESQRDNDKVCVEDGNSNDIKSNVGKKEIVMEYDQENLINKVPHPFDESDPSIVRERESVIESEKLSMVAECNCDGSKSLSSGGYDWDVDTLNLDASSPRSSSPEQGKEDALSLSSSSSISDMTDSYLTSRLADGISVFSSVDSLEDGSSPEVAHSTDNTVVSSGVTGTESASTVPTANLDKGILLNGSQITLANDSSGGIGPEQEASEQELLSSNIWTDNVGTVDESSIQKVANAIDSFGKILDEIEDDGTTENEEQSNDDDTEIGDEIDVCQDFVSPVSPLVLTIAASCEEGEERKLKDELERKLKDEFRQRVIVLLEKSAPEELDNVDAMIEAFSGGEDELLENLQSMHERNVAGRLRVENQKLAKIEARKTVAEQQQVKKVEDCMKVTDAEIKII